MGDESQKGTYGPSGRIKTKRQKKFLASHFEGPKAWQAQIALGTLKGINEKSKVRSNGIWFYEIENHDAFQNSPLFSEKFVGQFVPLEKYLGLGLKTKHNILKRLVHWDNHIDMRLNSETFTAKHKVNIVGNYWRDTNYDSDDLKRKVQLLTLKDATKKEKIGKLTKAKLKNPEYSWIGLGATSGLKPKKEYTKEKMKKRDVHHWNRSGSKWDQLYMEFDAEWANYVSGMVLDQIKTNGRVQRLLLSSDSKGLLPIFINKLEPMMRSRFDGNLYRQEKHRFKDTLPRMIDHMIEVTEENPFDKSMELNWEKIESMGFDPEEAFMDWFKNQTSIWAGRGGSWYSKKGYFAKLAEKIESGD
tara:strand:- start:212 stop:1288 length:1077 start_codon:yes stop_codon:yes gene_type:complete